MIEIYEIVDFSHGNTDYLSDFEDTSDIKRNMIAYYPQTVESESKIKKAIRFVENVEKYPKSKIIPFDRVVSVFSTIVGSYSTAINKTKDKKRFRENLLKLKEYVETHKGNNMLNENEINDLPRVRKFSLEGKEEYATELSNKFLKKSKIGGSLNLLGGGNNGFAYKITNSDVLKITCDTGEAETAVKLLNENPKYLAKPSAVYRIIDTETNQSFYVIILEFIPGKSTNLFNFFRSRFSIIKPFGYGFGELFHEKLLSKNSFDYEGTVKIINGVLTENQEVGIDMNERKKIHEFMLGIANIKKELIEYGSESLDFTVSENLGYKDGNLKYFDYGGYRGKDIPIKKENHIFLENLQLDENAGYWDVFDRIADKLETKLRLGKLKKLNGGSMGYAYEILGKDLILKITKDKSEFYANKKLMGGMNNYLATPHNVFALAVEGTTSTYFAIILEKLETNPSEFRRLLNRLKFVFSNMFGVGLVDVFEHFVYGNKLSVEINKEELLSYMLKNKEDGWFFQSLLRIGKELVKNDISSIDFLNPNNLGFRDNDVVFFDIGMSDYVGSVVNEDGSSLFSTDTSNGRDDYPPQNKNILPPDIENDLNANSSIYERKIGWMDGSETVEVKKKCKIGGLGNTSADCNQGDVDNLIIKKVK